MTALSVSFSSHLWDLNEENYLCAFTRLPASTFASLGRLTVHGIGSYHHLSLYMCSSEVLVNTYMPCTTTVPTVYGCEEMLYTFSASGKGARPPEDVHFGIPKLIMFQLHTMSGLSPTANSVSVSISMLPPRGPLVRFVEIGPRRDWGGLKMSVAGKCECTRADNATVYYVVLHAHRKTDTVCLSIPETRTLCAPRDTPFNVVVPWHVSKLRSSSSPHLVCHFPVPSRLGVRSDDEMCFAYMLVESRSWPYHCWSSSTERTCRW